MRPMSLIVVTLNKVFAWFMILFGSLVIMNGHNTPGGGFQGGAVVATFVCFMLVAYGGKKFFTWVHTPIYSGLETFGLLAFFVFACLGFPNSFTYNFLAVPAITSTGGLIMGEVWGGWLPSCGTISLMNIAVGFEVVGALSLAVIEMYEGTHIDDAHFGGECGHDR
ncbi:MAG: sodium:proton antiporter [Synergistaceae bacterium]|nr:sodium:proton antiporter [Synergistaceae bacterium]